MMFRRLAVVAGAGALVPQVVASAQAGGAVVRVFALTPLDLPAGTEHEPASLCDPQELFASIRAFGATHLTLAGAVALSDADRRRIGGALGATAELQGDAALSTMAVRLRQLTGADLIGVHQIVPQLLAPKGNIAGPKFDDGLMASAILALRAARQVGLMDLGQAAVVAGYRVVAVEDVAGTDELLQRVGRHRAAGLVGDTEQLVLAKAMKPQQPLFVDLPAIGAKTIEGAAASGIGTIALQAGRTLLLERAQMVELAERHGITVVGLDIDG